MAPFGLRLLLGTVAVLVLGGGCATAPVPTGSPTDPRWLQEGVAQGLPFEDPLRLSNATRDRIRVHASQGDSDRARMRQLVRFLVDSDGLNFQYRSTRTLDAEDAFHAREGDCMSYAMLYVAAARSLGIEVHFVRITELPVFWEDTGKFFTSSHIAVAHSLDTWQQDAMVVDFSATHTSEWRFSLYAPVDDDTAFVLFHSNRAVEMLLAGNTTGAEQILRYMLDHAPAVPEVYNNLGIVLMRQHRPHEATELYGQAIARFPRFVPLYSNAVLAAAASDLPDLVKEWTLTGRKVAESDPAFRFTEGMMAFRQGDFSVAAQHFVEALEVQPEDLTLLAWTARAHLSAGEMDRGLRDVKRIQHGTPSEAQRALLTALQREFPSAGIVVPANPPPARS